MGQTLSVDSMTNIIFGVAMAAIGGITIVQTAHLARIQSRSIVPDLERGQTADIEMVLPTTQQDLENQNYPTYHSAAHDGNFQDSSSTSRRLSLEIDDACMDLVSLTEQLQGIGASFADGHTLDEAGVPNDGDTMVDSEMLGRDPAQVRAADGDPTSAVASS